MVNRFRTCRAVARRVGTAACKCAWLAPLLRTPWRVARRRNARICWTIRRSQRTAGPRSLTVFALAARLQGLCALRLASLHGWFRASGAGSMLAFLGRSAKTSARPPSRRTQIVNRFLHLPCGCKARGHGGLQVCMVGAAAPYPLARRAPAKCSHLLLDDPPTPAHGRTQIANSFRTCRAVARPVRTAACKSAWLVPRVARRQHARISWTICQDQRAAARS